MCSWPVRAAPALSWIRSVLVGAYEAVASTALRSALTFKSPPKRSLVQLYAPTAPTLQRGRVSSSCSSTLHDQTPSGPDTPHACAGAAANHAANSEIQARRAQSGGTRVRGMRLSIRQLAPLARG